MKRPILPIAITALVLLTVGAGTSSAATFSLAEPFNTPGALAAPWVASGTVIPSVVAGEAGDSPINALRLTNSAGNQRGFVLYDEAIPISSGIDISFHQAQFGGDGGADGIAFFVKDAADTMTAAGGSGGSLGYSIGRTGGFPTVDGISGALLGVGLDGYGNFDQLDSDGTGCTPSGFVRVAGANSIALRGPGQGLVGYCLLADAVSLRTTALNPLTNGYLVRSVADRLVRVVIDPATAADPKVTVFYEGTQVIQVALPAAFTGVAGVKIGFSAGSGGSTDFHDVWGLTTTAAPAASAAPAVDAPALAATGPNQTGIIASGVGALLLIIGGALTLMLTLRRRRTV